MITSYTAGTTSNTGLLTDNTFALIELYFEHINSGNAELFVNGVSEITVSAQDFFDSGIIRDLEFLGSTVQDVIIDSFYYIIF